MFLVLRFKKIVHPVIFGPGSVPAQKWSTKVKLGITFADDMSPTNNYVAAAQQQFSRFFSGKNLHKPERIINHGIDLDLLDKIEKLAMQFFMLPIEEKQKYPIAPGTIQGYGQAFVFSEDQKLDWCNMYVLGIVPDYVRVPELWTTNPPAFGYVAKTDH
ncbi:protein SRG1 [Tanacetum coccineum]